jgi:hypothetical protein
MSKNKSLVEDTFLQMRNLEEVINENAKGILASTMKEEIRSLVKESLNEQDDEEEIDLDAELDDTDVSDDEVDNIGDEDEDDDQLDVMAMDTEFDDEDEDDTIDLTGASAEDVLKVFKAMGPEDGVIVKREDDMIHLSDDNNDVDYFIQLSESEQEDDEKEMLKNDELDESWMEEEDDVTETIYEIEMDEEDGDEDEYHSHLKGEMEERYHMDRKDPEDDDDDFDFGDLEDESDWSQLDEDEDEEFVIESKSNFKTKGVGMGNASKFKYDKKPNQGQGFKTKMKQGTRGVGMGKAKFEYKEGENLEKGKNTIVKKMETKEASRTLGNGSNFRKGGLPKPRAHSKANTAIKKESVDARELQILREKNEEYRNALNVFRDKLNEVAVFNSNLAYATRLFTEHSTTKQEKINILKRFDSVETLKESKNLYRSIKDELSDTVSKDSNTITESFERTVEKTPTSGSAVNLIESKTYENPQFLRMKDLMSKIK